MISDIAICMTFILSLRTQHHIFDDLEIILFALTLLLLLRFHQAPFLLSTFFVFIFPPSLGNAFYLPIAMGVDPWDTSFQLYQLINTSREYVAYLAIAFVLFLIAQALNIKSRNKNFSRKIFHFFGFVVYFKMEKLSIVLGELIAYSSAWAGHSGHIAGCLPFLLKKNEIKKDCFSLTILVFLLSYAQTFLIKKEFFKLLISICIHDSFASFTGGFLKKKQKSVEGFVIGMFFSCLSEYLIFRSADILYHFLMGLVELKCPINDNLGMGMASILYHVVFKLIF